MEPAEISAFPQVGKRAMVRCRSKDQTMVYGTLIAFDSNGLLLDEDPSPQQENANPTRIFIPWHEIERIY